MRKSKIFQVYWSVDFVILSVCLSITYRSQFKTDLQETLPNCRGSLNWEIYWFWCHISKIVIFHPIDLKFEQDLHVASLDWETNYLWDQKVKGQLEVKLLKPNFIWKIVNFHLIDLITKQQFHITSLNWENNYFWCCLNLSHR